jgi:hypothetical protein
MTTNAFYIFLIFVTGFLYRKTRCSKNGGHSILVKNEKETAQMARIYVRIFSSRLLIHRAYGKNNYPQLLKQRITALFKKLIR